MISSTQITAVLLAGGRSRRMGRDKAFIRWGAEAEPLWKRQFELLQALAPAECIVSARPAQVFPGPVTVVLDENPGGGPLAALATVAARASQPYVLPIAVDTPHVTVGFLRALLSSAGERGLVYRGDGFFEPFPALYPCTLAPLLEECLAAGESSMQAMISLAIERRLLDAAPLSEPDSALFKNLNTPEDL